MKKPQHPCFSLAKRREFANHATWPHATLRLSLFLLAFLLGITGARAQTDSTATGDPALEVQVPCQYLEINTSAPSPSWWGFRVDGNLRTNNSNYEDWFTTETLPTPFQGVISEAPVPVNYASGTRTPTQFRADTELPVNNRNLTYVQRMHIPPPPFPAGFVLLDAVAARDNHTAGGEVDATIFTSGSDKNGANTNTWMPGSGSVPQKVDLIDVGGHIRKVPDSTVPGGEALIAVAFATTRNVDGDAHVDFEIFREELEVSGSGFINGGPQNGHTAVFFQALPATGAPASAQLLQAGDILVSIDYSNGGTEACGSVWIWVNPNNIDGAGSTLVDFNNLQPNQRPYTFTGDFFSGTGASPFGYARIEPNPGTSDYFFAAINQNPVLGTTWGNLTAQNATSQDNAEALQVVEIGLDFTRMGLITSDLLQPSNCGSILGTLLVKSRSSGSVTSEMKDFAGPYLFGVKYTAEADAGPDGTLQCQTTSVTLTGSTTTPGNPTVRWYAVGNPDDTLSNSYNLTVTQSGCYVFEVTSPFSATCIGTDTACVWGTPDTIPPSITCPPSLTLTCLSQIPAPATSLSAFVAQGGTISGLAPGEGTISHSDSPAPPYNQCGDTLTRTYTIADSCGNESICTQQITINDNIPPVINGPGNLTLGCNPVILPGQPGDATATDNCGTVNITVLPDVITGTCSKTLTRTWRATDACGNTANHVQVITYKFDTIAPVITVSNCSVPTLPCNPTLAQINGSLGTATVTDNCDNGLTPTVNTVYDTISTCGGRAIRTWTVSDLCGNQAVAQRCTVLYKVDNTAPVITLSNCGVPTLPCNPTLAQINGSLGTATVTDNCDNGLTPTVNTVYDTISTCGGRAIRTWTVSDLCGNQATAVRCTVLYKVDNTAPVITVSNCGVPTLPCNPTLAQINGSLGTATVTDNCDNGLTATFTTTHDTIGCNGRAIRTWNVSDLCGNPAVAVRCTVTYTVDNTPPVVNCNVPGGSITVCEGSNINYPTPSATDNCTPGSLTVNCTPINPVPAPGTSVTVTCSATDQCGNVGSCTYSIRVVRNPSCSILVPSTKPLPNSCNNNITAAVTGLDGSTTYTWTVTGGTGWSIQSSNGASATYCAGTGSALICLEVKNIVNGVECVSTCCDTVECQKQVECTYTQGYYGNAGGNNCTGGNTTDLLNILLGPTNGDLIIGNCDCPSPGTNRCLVLTQADISCIYRRLPGGGPPASINVGEDGAENTCDAAPGIPQKGNGSFRNVLVAQTITLGLNMRIPGSSLGSLQITDQYLVTQEADGNGCSDPAATPLPNTESVHIIPQAVIDYLGTNNTVQDLFELANLAISGCLPAGAPSLSTINQAVSAFNEGFDECRYLVGFQDTNPLDTTSSTTSSRMFSLVGDVNMQAYPNPAGESTQIEFVLNGFESEAALEVFTLQGVRIATLFNAPAEADVAYRTRFDVTHLPSGLYIYQLTTSKGVLKDKITIIR